MFAQEVSRPGNEEAACGREDESTATTLLDELEEEGASRGMREP
jgi:hypothetical protein